MKASDLTELFEMITFDDNYYGIQAEQFHIIYENKEPKIEKIRPDHYIFDITQVFYFIVYSLDHNIKIKDIEITTNKGLLTASNYINIFPNVYPLYMEHLNKMENSKIFGDNLIKELKNEADQEIDEDGEHFTWFSNNQLLTDKQIEFFENLEGV